jgi:hypothetical protein
VIPDVSSASFPWVGLAESVGWYSLQEGSRWEAGGWDLAGWSLIPCSILLVTSKELGAT